MLVAVFSSCKQKMHYTITNKKNYPVTSALPSDSSILTFYKPYKKQIDSQMNFVIGIAEIDITAAKPEGSLNTLLIDAMAYTARKKSISFDIVHNNYKSLRVPISKGEIRRSKVFELMPFENLLVTVKMNGGQVKQLLDYIAEQGGDPLGGASFTIVEGKAQNISLNDKPLNPTSVYTILTGDYVANGGDGASIYLEATDRKEYPIKVRDALLEYIEDETKSGKMISPKVEGRIKIRKKQGNE